MKESLEASDLPEEADMDFWNNFIVDTYQETYKY